MRRAHPGDKGFAGPTAGVVCLGVPSVGRRHSNFQSSMPSARWIAVDSFNSWFYYLNSTGCGWIRK